MARKTKEEAARTRVQILETALVVFAEKGFARATLQDIAERAGFTRGAVYWHFKDKVDLLVALAADMEGRGTAEPTPVVTSLAELEKLLAAYLRRFRHDQPYGMFYRTVMLQTGWTDEVAPLIDWFRDEQRQVQGWLEHCLEALQAAGEVKSGHTPTFLALSVSAMVNGLVSQWLMEPESFDMQELAPALLADHLRRLSS